jgi:hypothetical protein
MLNANTLYVELVDVVAFGFASPVRAASLSSPQESEERITRTSFVAADPLVVQDSCKSQLIVSVQALSWAFGPWRMNIPTSKLYFCTSVPGEWDQHSV